MNDFGDFLYSLRKEKGLTQVELANLLNVTNKAVSKWETGEAMPETSLLLPLSNILGVSVDELLQGKKNIGFNAELKNVNHLYRTNNNLDKTFLEKVCGAVCATVILLGLTSFFIVGIIFNVWTPYWVIIPISALLCGIIGIIFDLFNSRKKQEKLKRGENIYLGSVCGLVMLLCIITYLLLGAVFNLWHPYWIILILGIVFCGITSSYAEVFKNRNKNRSK